MKDFLGNEMPEPSMADYWRLVAHQAPAGSSVPRPRKYTREEYERIMHIKPRRSLPLPL